MTRATKLHGELENYLSQVEAARIIGISKQAMSNLVRRGYFNTTEVAGRILICRFEVESLGARHKGRPRKEVSDKKKASTSWMEKKQKESSANYISQTDAASIRGVSRQAIANLIRRGRLTTITVAGRTLVLRSEIEAFVPQPVGHPPKRKIGMNEPHPKKSK